MHLTGQPARQRTQRRTVTPPLTSQNAETHVLGVKGSPVQIRPSRRGVKAWLRVSATGFGCNGSERALPPVAPAKRSGVSCLLGMLTSDNWHQRVRVPTLAPSPPTRVSFAPGQGVAGADPGVKACRAAAQGRPQGTGCPSAAARRTGRSGAPWSEADPALGRPHIADERVLRLVSWGTFASAVISGRGSQWCV